MDKDRDQDEVLEEEDIDQSGELADGGGSAGGSQEKSTSPPSRIHAPQVTAGAREGA